MSVTVIKAGLQTTLQGGARTGVRHFGVPASGPADPLSMSLANRLVGNEDTSTAIEITMTGATFSFSRETAFAVTGAQVTALLGEQPVPMHETIFASSGDILSIGRASAGCRSYLAVSGRLKADSFMGSESTYLPAAFGGFAGRALRDGDEIETDGFRRPERVETPWALRPYFNDRFVLQVIKGPDFGLLSDPSVLFDAEFTASQRSSRMGVRLEGHELKLADSSSLKSSAVFPGTIQCPPDGNPFALLVDGQTTGGYPHILQVSKADRFQLGQVRPGGKVRFVARSADYAAESYRTRYEAYAGWLSGPVI